MPKFFAAFPETFSSNSTFSRVFGETLGIVNLTGKKMIFEKAEYMFPDHKQRACADNCKH